MKKGNQKAKIISVALAAVLGCGTFAALAGCKTHKKDTLVIMTQELNGLYNPFFSTSGTDMDVVGQTQISMFTTNSAGDIAYGDDEAVVVKDFEQKTVGGETVYTFVLKNNIKFSDGKPLTMNDVLFNMYVYLDPTYTGSTTMYSTDIVGLQKYRTQQNISGDGSSEDTALTTRASNMAKARRDELITAYTQANEKYNGQAATTNDVSEDQMREFLADYSPRNTYRRAIWTNGEPGEDDLQGNETADEAARRMLISDYDETLRLFKEELNNDFNAAKDTYSNAPYTNEAGKDKTNTSSIDFSSEVVSFMYMEGYITLAYEIDPATGKENKNKIVDENSQQQRSRKNYNEEAIELKDKNAARNAAIDFVYDDKITGSLDLILNYWSTGSTLLNNYIGKAKDVILHENLQDGALPYSTIDGIKSLGHNTDIQTVTVDGTEYKVAHNHNADGTPANENEYDVLQIRINGTDPKAKWNFGFTVAPHHYYSDAEKYPVDIANDKFGVEWASYKFMTDIIQGGKKNKVPLGAGPYVATNRSNGDDPAANEFYTDNIVYYKANENFLMGAPKIKKMQYVVVSSSNALDRLERKEVDFVEPQFTLANSNRIKNMKSKGYDQVNSWQLGYGYIGINAGKVPNINLRKAIMAAMNTALSLEYYVKGEATTIAWPMSLVSWAYPRVQGGTFDPNDPLKDKEDNNNHDYARFTTDEAAKANIRKYMGMAGVSENDSKLSITFTIAGSNLTDHPCYAVFDHARELLNACGWNVEVSPDTQALTKLSTGSLAVWAAAWGSTIDPDMYQVYHKNSTASSTFAWGYREILASPASYSAETTILNQLSILIDSARETEDQNTRSTLYKEAMGKVLDLAIELPVYQRKTLYAYNANVIDVNTLPHDENDELIVNSYSSPLSRIWEVDLVK